MGDYKFLAAMLLAFLLGAVSHEHDLSRNFQRTGDAKAWFFEIKEATCQK